MPNALCLTPSGRLILEPANDAAPIQPAVAERLEAAFARGPGYGLLQLGASEVGTLVPPVFSYWRTFAARFVTVACTSEAGPTPQMPSAPAADELDALVSAAPLMAGAEYLTAEVLRRLWAEIGQAFAERHAESKCSIQEFLKTLNPAWNLVGRVNFNLAENRGDPEAPFAFLATYTGSLSAQGKAQHRPLGQALTEYSGAGNKERLLSLLLPVQRASTECEWLKAMLEACELFQPMRWSPAEAFRMLSDAPLLERAGVIVRMPATWKARRPARPTVKGTVGSKSAGSLGKDGLLDFQVSVSLDGHDLTAAEITSLLEQSSGLALIRGQWVEVDRERLQETLSRFEQVQALAAQKGLHFADAMRMVSGLGLAGEDAADAPDPTWSAIEAGPWLDSVLEGLRAPHGLAMVDPGPMLKGTLRPYQQAGVRWLHLLSELGLGACLADDMGLGKTMQVLSTLLVNRQAQKHRAPSLLVAPASLLSNWEAEIARFAPSLKVIIAHPSAMPSAQLKALTAETLSGADVVMTSYGSLLRLPWAEAMQWNLAILDEAQAIKNAGTKQSKAVKRLTARARIALTGTPVENHLGDLWSIFDFINPGLLGSAKVFRDYTKKLSRPDGGSYAPLRNLVRPYILRRLKTDKSVISDLPDKIEVKAFCQLSRSQIALYQRSVETLKQTLESADGMKRKGAVLAALLRFKQICNHPSQWLGDNGWAEADSGKFARLRELTEVIAAKQEKLLIFTQFREMTEPLSAFLASIFGRPGVVLHGGTNVKQRRGLVKRFQEDESVPFFVLSLKAGGSGLNLTAASHVIHFDRWWNPAVENQATDRAFRIGQKKNVLVHKFVCTGTVEEKIDALIESKKTLATELLQEGGAELNLTELSNEALLSLVALDVGAAMKE